MNENILENLADKIHYSRSMAQLICVVFSHSEGIREFIKRVEKDPKFHVGHGDLELTTFLEHTVRALLRLKNDPMMQAIVTSMMQAKDEYDKENKKDKPDE